MAGQWQVDSQNHPTTRLLEYSNSPSNSPQSRRKENRKWVCEAHLLKCSIVIVIKFGRIAEKNSVRFDLRIKTAIRVRLRNDALDIRVHDIRFFAVF